MRIHKRREKKDILMTEAELGEELSLSLLVPHISYHCCLLTLSNHRAHRSEKGTVPA